MSNEATTSSVQDGDDDFIPDGAIIIRHVNTSSAQRRRRGRGEGSLPPERIHVGNTPYSSSQQPNKKLENLRYPQENFMAPQFKAAWEASSSGNPNKPMHGEGSSLTNHKFIPHRLVVNPGEDVAQKISEFANSATRAICVLSGSGVIARVTLNLYGCTTTYEGRFDIISLSGSLVPAPGGHGRTGGLAIMLSGKQGSPFGGRISGNLIADTPVQVIVGNFKVQDC